MASERTATKIPLNATNIMRCKCTECPVQANSGCVKGKMTAMQEAMMKDPVRREDVPGVYCGTGTAACQDLDSQMKCICNTCPIYAEYNLAQSQPMAYYCQRGSAK